MPATLATYDAVLRETWTSKRVVEQLYNENPLLDIIEKRPSTTVGAAALTPIHTSRNGGYTASTTDGGIALNPAGGQGLKQASWQYTRHNMQVGVDESAVDGTSSDVEAVVSVLDFEVTGAMDDLRRHLSRQLFANGDAIITACGVTSASNTVVLNAVDGAHAIRRGFLHVGALVDIGSAANETSVAADRTITAVNEATPSITISGATVTTASTDFVSWANSRSGATSNEMNGLRNIVSQTATLGGISVASEPTWKASMVDNTSQALTVALLNTLDDSIFSATGKEATHYVTSVKQRSKLYNLLQSQIQFAGDGGLGAGKRSNVQYNGKQVIAVPDCPDPHFYALTVDELFIVQPKTGPYWQNEVEGRPNRFVWQQGFSRYVAKFTHPIQLGTQRRNAHSAFTNLT